MSRLVAPVHLLLTTAAVGVGTLLFIISGASQAGPEYENSDEQVTATEIPADAGASESDEEDAATSVGHLTHMVGPGARSAFGWYVHNNVWNAGDLLFEADYWIDSAFSYSDMTEGTLFLWHFPQEPPQAPEVLAYPSVLYGYQPHGGGINETDTARILPAKISSIETLIADYSLSITGQLSRFNVAFDLWLTDQPLGDASSISHEIMIWIHKGAFDAAGDEIGRYSEGQISASIFRTGTYVAVVLQDDLLEAELDISAILRHLVEQQIISENVYLASIELGAEVVSGFGSLALSNLDLELGIRDAEGEGKLFSVTGAGTSIVGSLDGESR